MNYKAKGAINLKQKGFTILELLVVIAIIGILVSIALAAMSNAKSKAQAARAILEMKNLRTSITMLENDTNKWPNGCPIDATSNPEVNLVDANAGILSLPNIFSSGGCQWTTIDRNKWKGPYANNAIDQWSNSYVFDPDYHVCVDSIDATYPVIVTYGENGTQNYPTDNASFGEACNLVDSDDIYIKLVDQA